jgi:tripartite-type tricarboxylate transporter receptor subunit TctC
MARRAAWARSIGHKRVCAGLRQLAAAALACLLPAAALAQSYPNRPIRLICPQAVAGPTDVAARLVGDQLAAALGQPVVVENHVGAATAIGTQLVAKSPPDGYTLLVATVTTLAINPGLYPHLAYDPVRDFEPVSLVAAMPMYLIADPRLPVRGVQDLIALARARPGQLNYGSPGSGTSPHLAGALFASMAGVQVVHVPYKGAAAAQVDMMTGLIQFDFDAGALPTIQAGKLRGLGVASVHRSAAAPEIPTIAEQGLPGFEAVVWTGIVTPAGTPAPIVGLLSRTVNQVMNTPEVRERMLRFGGEVTTSTPQAFAALIQAEMTKWARVIRDSGARPE